MRIIGHLSQNFHTSFSSLRGSFFYSHPPLSQLIQIVVSRAFYSKCIERVHTSRLVALGGEGREEVTCGAWHTSSTTPCSSQVTVSHLDICGGFSRPNGTVRESTTRERKLTDIPAPRKIWPPTPFTCPCPLDYRLICRLYWSFSTFTVLVEFGKRQVRPHEGA